MIPARLRQLADASLKLILTCPPYAYLGNRKFICHESLFPKFILASLTGVGRRDRKRETVSSLNFYIHGVASRPLRIA